MNRIGTIAFVVAAVALGACGGNPPAEPQGSTASHLDVSCVGSINGNSTPDEMRAALARCFSDGAGAPSPHDRPRPTPPPPAPAGTDDPTKPDPGGVGFNPPFDPGDAGDFGVGGCSTQVICMNGSCSCSGGPNAGGACDGTTSGTATSCDVLCTTC
jgi:hypothetical protein